MLAERYGQTNSKLYSVGVILGGMIFCLIISFLIYLSSMIFIYGVWHCPSGNCNTPTWANVTVFLLLASPLFVFCTGAYLCRKAVYALTENLFLRIMVIAFFAMFPLLLLIGLIAYIINSPK